ncbi:LYR motif-containing protein 7 [Temnothorax longispinosus]|uniref:LYR motif-containing protein 7 n=1 Tax=Temnothorax longispinosus TaxID=300112 RepID=A0A4V3SAS8_9HYME|nr:LYR motif-containing protein 7 [Temnothorax longispinosus]
MSTESIKMSQTRRQLKRSIALLLFQLNKFAQEVEHEVRTTVIQAFETAPGRVALRITPDVLVDNMPYKNQKDNKSSKVKTKDGKD